MIMRGSRHGGGRAGRSPTAPVALLVLCVSQLVLAEELVSNGDFGPGVSSVDPGSTGTYSGISGADMMPFPGTKTTALRLMPGSAAVTITAANRAHTKVGWYRVQFFVYVHPAYRGSTASAFTIDVVDSAGAVVSLHPYAIPLRSARGEWLHYNEWVPCNRCATTPSSCCAQPHAATCVSPSHASP